MKRRGLLIDEVGVKRLRHSRLPVVDGASPCRPDPQDSARLNQYDVRMQYLRGTLDRGVSGPAVADWYQINGLVREARQLTRRAARLLELTRDHHRSETTRRVMKAVRKAKEARRAAVDAIRREWKVRRNGCGKLPEDPSRVPPQEG